MQPVAPWATEHLSSEEASDLMQVTTKVWEFADGQTGDSQYAEWHRGDGTNARPVQRYHVDMAHDVIMSFASN